MTVITQVMVAPYFTTYAAKFGQDCTLSLDVMEEIMSTASNEDAMLNDMHEAMTATDETDVMTGRDVTVTDVIESGSAFDYAKKMDDAEFRRHLDTNAEAALENKRGAAIIRRDLVRLYTLPIIENVWPIPGSDIKSHPETNRQLGRYTKAVKDQVTGETKQGTVDWYAELYDGSPDGRELALKINSINSVKKNEIGSHIYAEHEKLRGNEIKIMAEISYLSTMRANKKNAIVRTVNLIQQMARLNSETEMSVRLITEDGTPEGEPVRSNKLIYAKNSKGEENFRILTIGQVLALDVDKAVANGGSYLATIGTTGRQPRSGTGPQEGIIPEVTNLDMFDKVTASYASFFDKLNEAITKKDMKAYNALLTRLNAAGSDDMLLSLNLIMNGIEAILSKPGIDKRLGALLADGTKAKAA